MQQVERLDGALSALGVLSAFKNGSHTPATRILSVAARKRIAEAQRQRWATYRSKRDGKHNGRVVAIAKHPSATATAKKKPHWTQTPEGRAFMSRTAKKRFGKEK